MNKFTLLLFCLLVFHKNTEANHALSAELTYTSLGSDVYKFKYTFYRDCSGTPGVSSLLISYSSTCFPGLNQFLVTALSGSPTEVSPICSSEVTTCNGGTYSGIEQWIYEGQVTLPGPCVDWQFYRSEGVRNLAITTITGAGIDDLFVYATLNNTNNLSNNSPKFSNLPVPFVCLNHNFVFNHGVSEGDGDSLVFELVNPRTGPLTSDTVQYLPGYSVTQPMNSSPPMTFNPATGEFTFVAVNAAVTVLAVLIKEFRNGTLIGQVVRDMQLNLMPCSNTLPALTGINGTPVFNSTVCSNQNNCFLIKSVDNDSNQSTVISWDQSIPTMTVTNTNGQRDSAYFCWTPTPADTIGNPHCILVTVTDDNCPYFGSRTYTYYLTVDNSANCIPIIPGIEKVTMQTDINIYPQPARDFIMIDLKNNFHGTAELIMENIYGAVVGRYSLTENLFKIELPEPINAGLYIILVKNNSDTLVSRKSVIVSR